MTRITQQQLESYLWNAAVLLRGTIDAGDYKQYIFPLLFYKRLCDVFDEETQAALDESGGDIAYAGFPETHRFQIPPEAHWNAVRQVAQDVGMALQKALRAIETANPDKFYGIFGDAQWTNKERLSDAMLRDLIEHFSTLKLTIANLPEDELGQGYEYLIKKFADDSGHTAAEFYTNRTVVHLMTELLQPQSGESIYDPTCGSGGMLLSCIAHLRRQGQEWRNVRLYGQERNLMTSAIARMNCFLHGIEDFRIESGDTLSDPKFVEGDQLMRFDLVLANPPYSIKQWDRDAFAADPWGRNLYGTPPQGRADYAFWQHILRSLAHDSGRCAILFPHGVLFRQEEAEMRRGLIEADLIECVLGLGPNLFYNSPMEACVVICRAKKAPARSNRILFINAVEQVARERAQSFLTDAHIDRIAQAYERFEDEPGFCHVATLEEIRERDGNLSIPLYVSATITEEETRAANGSLAEAIDTWLASRRAVVESLRAVLPDLEFPDLDDSLRGLDSSALFDWTDWQRARFGDVVRQVRETEHDPAGAGIRRYIGLAHLEPGSLHVREWGDASDGTSFTRRCRPGQVLFGKRRAYQRKVALAEFDAVVSGDIYVFEPKNKRLLPELLPFLCMSERFLQCAVETSAGSLSPRTNWRHLAKFEFDLPPLAQQRRLADVLWAVDTVGGSMTALADKVCAYRDSYFDARLRCSVASSPNTLKTLGCALEAIVAGKSPKASSRPADTNEYGVLKVSAVGDNRFCQEENKSLLDSAQFASNLEVRAGMVLVTRCNARLAGVGRACLVRETRTGLMLSDKTLQLVPDRDRVEVSFLIQGLCREPYRGYVERSASGTEAKNISQRKLRTAPFWLPSLDEQREIVQTLDRYEQCASKTRALRDATLSVRCSLTDAFAAAPPVRLGEPDAVSEARSHAEPLSALAAETSRQVMPSATSTSRYPDVETVRGSKLLPPNPMVMLNRLDVVLGPLTGIVTPDVSAMIDQVNRYYETVQRQHEEFLRQYQTIIESRRSRITELVDANTRWQSMLSDQAAVLIDSMRSDVHESWRDAMSMTDGLMTIQTTANLHMASVASMLNITEGLMAQIDTSAIAKSLSYAMPEWLALERSVEESMTSYGLLSAIIDTQQDLVTLPSYMLPGATREIFLTGYVVDTLDTISEREPDQAVDELVGEAKEELAECRAMLQDLDPALTRPYEGAYNALNKKGTDWERHVLISLRELCTQVLHRLAPKNEVLSWIPEGQPDLVYGRRPTRRANMLYICRAINTEPFATFVTHTTQAEADLFDLFNRVHSLEINMTEEQVLAMIYKVESWLLYVLRISRSNG